MKDNQTIFIQLCVLSSAQSYIGVYPNWIGYMSNQTGYERQNGSSSGRSWSLIIFIFFINLYVLLIIIDLSGSETFRNFCLIFALLIAGVKIIRSRMRDKSSANKNPLDMLSLIRKYFRINQRYLLVSIIGLILAIAIISQIILLTSSPVGNIYQDALGDHTPIIRVYEWQSGSDAFVNHETEIFEAFQQELEKEKIQADRMDFNTFYELLMLRELNISGESEPIMEQYYMGGGGISEQKLKELRKFPNFPTQLQSDNFTLLILDMFMVREIFGETNNYNLTNLQFSSFSGQPFSLDVDAIWPITNEVYNYINDNDLFDFYDSIREGIYVPQNQMVEFYEARNLEIRSQEIKGYVDVDSLQGMDPDRVILVINNLISTMYEKFAQLGFYQVDIYSEAEWRIEEASNSGAFLRTILLLISLPMLSIALYLVYFSLNLVERRKQNLVAIMKIRGISSNQLQIMMFVESIIGALIATSIAMAISIPWADYVLSTTKIFGETTQLFIPEYWWWRLPVIGVILAVDMNIFSIISVSNTTVEEGEKAEETSEPFWRRLYLDVIFTAIGVGLWLTIRYAPLNPDYYQIFLFFGIWSLPILILGIPLIVARFYSNFLTVISDFLWKREGNFIALATRNMRKNKFSASKLAVLLILGMMFSFVAIGVPGSFTAYAEETSYYQVGADISVDDIDVSNATLMEVFSNQTEIDQTTIVREKFLEVRSNLYYDVNVIGVDPNSYADVGFWEDDYASEDLEDLMNKLKQDEIIVHDEAIEALEWKIGTNTSIQSETVRINNKIGGTFKYWPRLLNYFYQFDNRLSSLFLVMSMDNYQSYFNETEATVLASTHKGVNQTRVIENLDNDFDKLYNGDNPYYIQGADTEYQEFVDSGPVKLLFEMLNNLLYVTIITSIIGVGYFSFITLSERRREIGVFRAVGMVSRQIFLLLLIESVILVSTSILIGILAGSFISSNLFLLFENAFGTSIPPIELYYPPVKTISFVLIAMIFSIIAAAIPARSTASKQTGSILRAE